MLNNKSYLTSVLIILIAYSSNSYGHGTCITPKSRVYRVFQSNIENPDFQLALNATRIDSKNAYYTWNEVSRNIPEAVNAGLPVGFDYSQWIPDGQIASGGRIDPNSFSTTYGGLDQISTDWPKHEIQSGETLQVDFYATAVHEPSVWDVWLTTPDWNPNTALNWDQMEFIERPEPILLNGHYYFDLELPADRSGHHVLWVAWHRDDPVGEVFFSTSDLFIMGESKPTDSCNQIANGTFDANIDSWSSWDCDIDWENGQVQVTNISIETGLSESAGIRQDGITLLNGSEYILECKAASTDIRTIGLEIETGDGSTIYSMSDVTINTDTSNLTFSFINNMLTTNNGILEFHLGGNPEDVYLDDIRISESSCISICSDTLHLASIDKSVYSASQSIFCSATIQSPTDVFLKAGDFLEFTSPFEIELGASIGMQIEDCQD